jgi:hypothetical protein
MKYVVPPTEFPFMAGLPATERKGVNDGWKLVHEVRTFMDRHVALIPVAVAAKALGVSKQRVHFLCNVGKLDGKSILSLRFVTDESLTKYWESNDKGGRPRKEK